MRIGELLIAERLVTPEQVDQALRAQIVVGGRLGTNLVEIGAIALDTLAQALGRQHDMPSALQRHFERCDAQVQRLLPADVAARWHAIPMGRLSAHPPQVAVAVTDPLPDEGMDELSDCLEAAVVLAIAPQLRVLYYLEQLYGVERLNRFRRAPTERGATREDESRRRYVQTLDQAVPHAPTALAKIAIRRIALPNSGVYELPPDTASIEQGLTAMRSCYGRSSLGEVVIRTIEQLLVPPLGGAMLMTLRDGLASGWTGFAVDGNSQVIESIALEVGRMPILSAAVDTGEIVYGPPPLDALHERLWSTLSLPTPAEMLAVPALLTGRPAAAIVAFASAPTGAETRHSLELLAEGIGQNFDRLLRAAER